MNAPAWLDELSLAAGPPWHAMGTRALDEVEWLLPPDADAGEQLQLKRDLLDTAADVVSATCHSARADEAAQETAELVAAATGHPLERDRPSLEAAALLVQEDLCVLTQRKSPNWRHQPVDSTGTRRQFADGLHWRLEAGVVCFPSMWRLSDKIGLPITEIHEPVPMYAEELAARVDRFVDRLRVDRPVWRRNWLVHDSPELHLPQPPPHSVRPVHVPEDLWLRSERQTLRRLPKTDAVVFTIRTQQAPLAVVAERSDVAAAMATAIEAWSPDLVSYRRAVAWRGAVVAWLTKPG